MVRKVNIESRQSCGKRRSAQAANRGEPDAILLGPILVLQVLGDDSAKCSPLGVAVGYALVVN
jgi:hypothetical protein